MSKIFAVTAFALLLTVNAQSVWAGGEGNDVVQVNGANGAGDDFRVIPAPAGREGNDVLVGNQGNDFVFGEGGYDIIVGSNGNDILLSGNGNDVMMGGYGGDGSDFLEGGEGMDTVQVNGANQPANDPYDHILNLDGNDLLVGGVEVRPSGDVVPVDQISINFGQIKFEYKPSPAQIRRPAVVPTPSPRRYRADSAQRASPLLMHSLARGTH